MRKYLLTAAMLSCLMLAACGESDAPDTDAVDQTPAAAPAPAAEPATSSGGYVPSESERVPGITMSQEELDKMYAEARANTPAPQIPEDAK